MHFRFKDKKKESEFKLICSEKGITMQRAIEEMIEIFLKKNRFLIRKMGEINETTPVVKDMIKFILAYLENKGLTRRNINNAFEWEILIDYKDVFEKLGIEETFRLCVKNKKTFRTPVFPETLKQDFRDCCYKHREPVAKILRFLIDSFINIGDKRNYLGEFSSQSPLKKKALKCLYPIMDELNLSDMDSVRSILKSNGIYPYSVTRDEIEFYFKGYDK